MSMTREEAIIIIERVAHTEAKWPGTEDTLEALDMAVSALRSPTRELVEKVWRAHWNESVHLGGFVYCSRCGYGALEANNYTFCPKCGSPFTDEAVEMVMERINKMEGMENESC